MEQTLPSIPAKRYFTIGEVADLCGVKPHVLRYWEQEFTQLRPMKRRGNRRYYQHHEVLMIRRIRDLLYDQGFTIVGARNKMQEIVQAERRRSGENSNLSDGIEVIELTEALLAGPGDFTLYAATEPGAQSTLQKVRQDLLEIREMLSGEF